jgi:histidinol-phosphate aminotransferase
MNESVSGLPAGFVKETLAKITPDCLAMYPEYRALERAIARHDGVRPGNICLSNGSDAAIKYIFDAYISPGDRVLLTDPTFAMYPVYCKMFRAKPVIVDYSGSFDFPYEKFINKLVPGLKMAVLVNPNNPTGSVIAPSKLRQIIKKAKMAGVILVIDEAYFYFYPHSAVKFVKKYDNLIVLRTFSKLCALACLRVGYAVANPGLIDAMNKVKPTFDVNGLGVIFAEKLMANPRVIRKMIAEVVRGKKFLMEQLADEGIRYRGGNANFVLINCAGIKEHIAGALKRKGILVSGGFKQPLLKDYIRVTVGNISDMKFFWGQFRHIWRGNKRDG